MSTHYIHVDVTTVQGSKVTHVDVDGSSMHVPVETVEPETDSDPSLDFTSPSFDALKALHTDPCKLQLPFPSVQPCDNLDAYESGKDHQVKPAENELAKWCTDLC